MSTTQQKVERLMRERPDLISLVRRILSTDGEGYFDTENPDDLAELVRRGLLEAHF